MKTAVTLTPENAAAVAQYAELSGRTPGEFLAELLNSQIENFADPKTGSIDDHLANLHYPTRASAERVLAWLENRIQENARTFGHTTTILARIEETAEGVFFSDQNRSFVGFNYGPHDKDLITYTVYAMGRQSKNLINADKVIKFGLPASFETIQNRNVKFRSDMPGIFTPRSPKRWTEPPGERFSSGPSRSFPDRWPVVRFRGP